MIFRRIATACNRITRGCAGSSLTKSMHCACREPEFSSQHCTEAHNCICISRGSTLSFSELPKCMLLASACIQFSELLSHTHIHIKQTDYKKPKDNKKKIPVLAEFYLIQQFLKRLRVGIGQCVTNM